MANRYISTIFSSGEEFEDFLQKLEAFKTGVENGTITIPKATKATQDGDGKVISETYAKITELTGGTVKPKYAGTSDSSTNVGTLTNGDSGNNAVVKFSIGDKTFNKTVNNVAYATSAGSATNVGTLTNGDSGDNAVVKFTIGDKTFTKTVNKVAYATSAGSATNVGTLTNGDSGANAVVKFTIGDKTFNKTVNNVAYATSAGSAGSATKATQDGNGNDIASTYATKTALTDGSLVPKKAASADNASTADEATALNIRFTSTPTQNSDGTITINLNMSGVYLFLYGTRCLLLYYDGNKSVSCYSNSSYDGYYFKYHNGALSLHKSTGDIVYNASIKYARIAY